MSEEVRAGTGSGAVISWIQGIGVSPSTMNSCSAELQRLGVNLTQWESEQVLPHLGVVAFDEPTETVCQFVRRAAHGYTGRIMAVCTSPAQLRPTHSWELLNAGASDVCSWSDADQSALHIAERLRRWQTIDELVAAGQASGALVGRSAAWRAVLRQAVEAALFTQVAVLITGESGTGKERVARLIHQLDSRVKKKDLVVLDCSTVVPSLSGSEFFGHEKGAFTGATSARAGAFELADGGTLFLDEVGELPNTLQAELLRAVQEGTYKRVGSNTWRRSTFRLICATNRDLAQEQEAGTFRNDFYFRIAGCRLHLPSLADRAEDIMPLFEHFYRQSHAAVTPTLQPAVKDLLLARAYPGNVRDLQSLVQRICRRAIGDGIVTVGDVPEEDRPAAAPDAAGWRDGTFEGCIRRGLAQGASLKDVAAAATQVAIDVALEQAGGNLQQAARALAVTDRALQLRQRAGRQREAVVAAGTVRGA